MSSKTQFKEALKGDKKIISDLKNKLVEREMIIDNLRRQILIISQAKKKWWQIWK